MIYGVLFKSIETSLPRPDPTPSASARIKLPLSLDPSDHFVSPFTFLVLRVLNSSSVNSKTLKTSEYEVFILSKNIYNCPIGGEFYTNKILETVEKTCIKNSIVP